eukprot:TRINITY_DN14143_c0_g1_i1.p1 TRINITY_DN14143_c0_g1~~TRINITY_DN14143_c0_g1_i1.p1  ORF type:complete len:1083 (+),score=375.85 TRINITY_DN14143_c0_g1_i1:73-3249(+)
MADAAPEEGAQPPAAPEEPAANFIGIELHHVRNVPAAWAGYNLGEAAKGPDYPDHAFLYEVEIDFPAPQPQAAGEEPAAPPALHHLFAHGRLRRLDERAEAFLEQGSLPPLAAELPGGADTAPGSDVCGPSQLSACAPAGPPRMLSGRTAASAKQGGTSGSSAEGSSAVEDAATSAAGTLSEKESATTSKKSVAAAPAPPAPVESPAPPESAEAAEAALGLLWLWPKPEVPEDDRAQAAKGGKKPDGAKPRTAGDDLPPPPSDTPFHVARLPLSESQVAALQQGVTDDAVIVVSLRRVLGPRCNPDWQDANDQRYRGRAELALRGFSEPGTESLTFQVPVVPAPPPPADPDAGKGAKKGAPKKAGGKGGAPPYIAQAEAETETHPYIEAAAELKVRLCFAKAIIALPAQRPRPDLKVSEVAPRRARPALRAPDAARRYRREVSEIAQSVVCDYRAHVAAQAPQTAQEARRAFMHYISSSGRAYAYRERLKHCVLGLVKQRFGKREGPDGAPAAAPDALELEKFYNELYCLLVDQMRESVDRTLSGGEAGSSAAAGSAADSKPSGDKWLRVAQEAEVVQEFAVAAKAHAERLVHGPSDPAREEQELPDMWADFAAFSLRVRDAAKAELAFKEALGVQLAHRRSLLGHGLLLLARGRGREAEVPLQSAVDAYPDDRLCWGCLYLWYQRMSQSQAERPDARAAYAVHARDARVQASRTAAGQPAERHPRAAAPPEAEEEPRPEGVESLDLLLTRFCLDLWLEDLALECVDSEEKRNGVTQCTQLLRGRAYYQLRDHAAARRVLEQGLLQQEPSCFEALALLGDLYATLEYDTLADPGDGQGSRSAARIAEAYYQRALAIRPHGADGAAYVRLGNIHLALGQYAEARDAFSAGVRVWPCGLTWLGVGVAYTRLGELAQAEQALNESVVCNNVAAQTWAYLALVCLQQQPPRLREADHAFDQAVTLGLADGDLYLEIGAALHSMQRWELAEQSLLRAQRHKDAAAPRLLMCACLLAMDRAIDAGQQLSAAQQFPMTEAERAQAAELERQVLQLAPEPPAPAAA